MKISNILLGAAALLALSACEMKDELLGGSGTKSEMGTLQLALQVQLPASMTRAAIATDNFPVTIIGVEGTDTEEVKKSYDRAADLPAAIQLPVGKYVVEAHSPGTLEKEMTAPYYGGEANLYIMKDVTEDATVQCRMKNSRIHMAYDSEFLVTFKSWTITLDDGQSSGWTKVYTEAEANPQDVYVHLGENVAAITVNIRAVTNSDNTVAVSYTLTKKDAMENYTDVDDENFSGGDALLITLKPTVSNTGTVPGISIDANILFTEYEEEVKIPVEDGDNAGEEPTPPTPPVDGDESLPSVELPADFTYSLSGTPAKPVTANAVLKTPAGLKSAIVKIVTDNADFRTTLQDATFDEPGALLTGAELIGNEALGNLFFALDLKESDGTDKKTPELNATEYEFPIHAFYTFLDMFTGTHQFEITLTDQNGETDSATLTITITE